MSIVLPTPILSYISTFDPSNDNEIQFSYTGNQISKKRIIITDNKTKKVVLDDAQVGMRLTYILSKNVLQPGQYIAQLQVFDFDNNCSELSSQVLFYCFTTPTLSFKNFQKKINASSVTLNLQYYQAEKESIKEYSYYLYNYEKSLLLKSSVFYDEENYEYTFLGLKNLSTYYVRCVGKTTHGMDIDTGYCLFNVEYITNPNNMLIDLTNHICDGYISVNCNIIDIGYKVDGGDPIFEDGQVVLDNKKITYYSGFDFSDNFSMFVKARKVPLSTPFFGYSTNTGNVELSIIYIATDYYCKLTAQSALGKYYRYVKLPNVMLIDNYSNALTDEAGNILENVTLDYVNDYIVVFEVKRKNGLYSLKAYYENNGYIEI